MGALIGRRALNRIITVTKEKKCIFWVHGTNKYAKQPPVHRTDKQATGPNKNSQMNLKFFFLKLTSEMISRLFSALI